jgi:two-component system, NarL family, nitrate/nitrite response regulator NarL
MIRIWIADDHQMVIDGLKALLETEQDIEVVGTATDGQQLLAAMKNQKSPVDLILLDINMPNMDGLEAAKALRKSFPKIKILVLSMYNKPIFIKNLIEEGVSGYILKHTGKEELLEAIHKIMNGQDYFSAEVTNVIMTSFRAKDPSAQVRLTKRELEILNLLTKALTTAEIANRLFLSTYTIDTHRKNLLSKLNLKNTPALVKYALENDLTDDKF